MKTWSPPEDDVVRKVGKSITKAAACRQLGVHKDTLVKRMVALNVPLLKWTHEKDDLLRQGRSRETGMSTSQIRRRERKLGIRRRKSWVVDGPWLARNLGKYGFDGCATKLKCSRRAVEIQAWRQGIHPDETKTDLSIRLVSEVLGVHRSTVAKWVTKGWLDATDGRVTPKTLRAFVVHHPLRVNPMTVGDSWPTLVQLIAGKW